MGEVGGNTGVKIEEISECNVCACIMCMCPCVCVCTTCLSAEAGTLVCY